MIFALRRAAVMLSRIAHNYRSLGYFAAAEDLRRAVQLFRRAAKRINKADTRKERADV